LLIIKSLALLYQLTLHEELENRLHLCEQALHFLLRELVAVLENAFSDISEHLSVVLLVQRRIHFKLSLESDQKVWLDLLQSTKLFLLLRQLIEARKRRSSLDRLAHSWSHRVLAGMLVLE
jgi:hypothetical protein